jgi:UDP-3-O-[3-hydroxymyristoyl] glucosamine N-acyltransferase
MEFTVKQIAQILDGKIEGDENKKISNLSKIEEGKPGTLSFLANPLYTNYIYSTEASVVIVNEDFIPDRQIKATLIRVKNAYFSFAKLLETYDEIRLDKKGISNQAFISKSTITGKDVYIGEFAYIGENVKLGDNVKIYPLTYIGDNVQIDSNTTIFANVKIYSDCIIGSHCNIHSGVIIGGDGFGFAPQENSNYKKVAQIGNVVIGNNVEVGANTTIDRATLGSTIIRNGVKLDNLIQIAHNVEIGENTVIAAQTGISGSTKIGKNCMIGGQVGIIGHLNIGDNVKIAAQSGIANSIEAGTIVQGSPAFEVHRYQKSYVHFRNLSKLVERIDELEEKINNIQKK